MLLVNQKLSSQIGAVYLYYAIYHKQPAKEFSRMRLSPDDWVKLQHLVNTLILRKNHCQPLFVLLKLLAHNCFEFVATEKECLRSYCPLNVQEQDEEFERLDLEPLIDSLVDPNDGLLNEINLLEVAYNETKEHLARATSELVVPTKVHDNLHDRLMKISQLMRGSVAVSNLTNVDNATPSSSHQDWVSKRISSSYVARSANARKSHINQKHERSSKAITKGSEGITIDYSKLKKFSEDSDEESE